ncbi:MAG: hypothetical protein LBQ58_05345 [Synergistaceae bacterium]|jgi:hypothetical protein|nr:hypothetical protein [Synergistaceae bacterium]
MVKIKVGIYISGDDMKWLEKFTPGESKSGGVNFIANWGLLLIRKGALSSYQVFDRDEQVEIIKVLKNFAPNVQNVIHVTSITCMLQDWFKEGGGVILGWTKDRIEDMLSKVSSLTEMQAMGLICWACGYWRRKDEISIEEYAGDFTQLIE